MRVHFLALGLVLFSPSAGARGRGVQSGGCEGCHGYDDSATITVSPLDAQPGETTTVRITVEDSDARVGGIFIGLDDRDQFSFGSGLAEAGNGITHTGTRSFSNNRVTYELTWEVPNTPGATRLSVAAVAANGNGNNGGDKTPSGDFDIVYGCEPQTFYRDLDGDGFGNEEVTRLFCSSSAPAGYAEKSGDCADGVSTRYPGAPEYCNRRDDDCDGEIDEGAIPVELYPDQDGDGFYSEAERMSGDMEMGCVPFRGYADQPGDCAPDNASANPDAEEVCDLVTDEECDGRIDERVRPLCGEGWCVRASFSCDPADCTPGVPLEETCNFIDDDCDGVVDEGELCEEGYVCAAGQCRDKELIDAVSGPPEVDARSDSESASDDSTAPEEEGDSTKDDSDSSGCTHSPGKTSGLVGMFLCVLAMGASRRRRSISRTEV